MKWFLFSVVCLAGSATLVRGDAAGDLSKKGSDLLNAGQFADAAQAYDDIITKYPTTNFIDDAKLRAGFAYMHLGDYAKTVDRLSSEILPNAKPEYRFTALYFTGLAQFSQFQKLDKADKSGIQKALQQTIATFTTLIDAINKTPTADNKVYLEDAIYYRALAEFVKEDFTSSEKDLLTLLQPPFDVSLKKPDYLLRLGGLYFNQAIEAMNATPRKSPEEIKALAQKALDSFDKVSNDPNALVQANEANLSKAQILNAVAQFSDGNDGYQQAIDAFHKVRRRDDMIEIQKARLAQLTKDSASALQTGGASLATANSLLIDRENGRLTELQNSPDPIIQAYLGTAACYLALKQPNEARTILSRLLGRATLAPDQQQQVDFEIVSSYALGGQVDKADKALTAYLAKYPNDPQADSISFQNANMIMGRKDPATGKPDNEAALAQAVRSLKDFPAGRNAAQALAIQVQALTNLGRYDDANTARDNFAKKNASNPAMVNLLLSGAQGKMAQGDFAGALDDYNKVKNNTATTPELQSYGAQGAITALNALKRLKDVVTESTAFVAKYPTSNLLPTVKYLGAAALAQDKDTAAAGITGLQDVAKTYPQDRIAPFALSAVVSAYQMQGNVPAMIQASDDLFKAYPTSYEVLGQAAEAVGTQYVKDKKFDLAAALYQKLTDATDAKVASNAYAKIGNVWYAGAKGMGSYQSMVEATRDEAKKRMDASEQAYLAVLKKYPDQFGAVGDALEGLVQDTKQRKSWGLIKDAEMEDTFGKLTADLTTPEMQTRVELAKAGFVLSAKNGAAQYPAALERFKKALTSSPGLRLTRQEANQYGELLLAAKDYPTALQVYTDLLKNSAANDVVPQGDADYGIGATYLAQGDLANAKKYFLALKALPNGGGWDSLHSVGADYGIALANESSSQSADVDAAKTTYGAIMKNSSAGNVLQAKAMLGYGRLVEKQGHVVHSGPTDTNEAAVDYYLRVDTFFGPAVPMVSAEGLYLAAQAYDKAGNKPQAQAILKKLTDTYSKTAPDWVTKGQTEIKP